MSHGELAVYHGVVHRAADTDGAEDGFGVVARAHQFQAAGVDHEEVSAFALSELTDVITPLWDGSVESLNKKIAEYTKAVIDGRPNFHISIVIDVSPNCDCHSENDAAIVPNVGMFASYDPVALDKACADAVNAMPINANTMLSENHHEGEDYFHAVHSNTHWEYCIEHAEKLGLGTREYEIVKI